MRLGSYPLRTSVEATAKILDSRGLIPRAPQALGGKTMTELLTDGDVQVTIDGKYPQAIGISAIMDRVGILGNSTWDVIISDSGQSPFFTSDFPTAIERSDDPRILNRIAPLAPDLVVRIRPDLAAKELRGDFSFPKFRFRTISPKNSETRLINQTIVRCAEQLVFFRDQADWVAPFLNRNRTFQIQPETIQIPVERGFMNVSTMRTRRAQSA